MADFNTPHENNVHPHTQRTTAAPGTRRTTQGTARPRTTQSATRPYTASSAAGTRRPSSAHRSSAAAPRTANHRRPTGTPNRVPVRTAPRHKRRSPAIPMPLFIAVGVLAVLVLVLLITRLIPSKDKVTATPQAPITLTDTAATSSESNSALGPVAAIDPASTQPAEQPAEQPVEQYEAAFAAPTENTAQAFATSAENAYLPIYANGNTTEKIIAITVDDCFQEGNLQTIIDLSERAGGKLTIFPIGNNILKGNIGEILKDAALNKGYEIENHTFNHRRIFRLSDEEMCEEIWKQWAAVCKTLNVNYKQHFFRLNGGDGKNDQRTHTYLQQLGFNGIAYWSYSGSDASLEDCEKRLSPGMVYLFHTTDRDTGVLKQFIPYVVSQGYRLVTLNEMFGLPDNEISDISTCNTTMPALASFTWDYKDIGKGDYSYRTWQIQNVLGSEGLLGDEAKEDGTWSGYYGGKTEAAVKTYQQNHGLTPTGVADRATQQTMLG